MSDIVKGLPYVGSKYKLMSQLKPLLERPQFNNFYDMMCGSGTVGANVDYSNVIMNDTNKPVVNILRAILGRGSAMTVDILQSIIADHELNASNKEAYYKLRTLYNDKYDIDPFLLLVLVYHAYNNMIRFNKKGRFNVPFGARTLNDSAAAKLKAFIERLEAKDMILFTAGSIGVWDYTKEPKDSLFYFDIPYSTGNAPYNKYWTGKHDVITTKMLDEMTENKLSWALSSALTNNGNTNKFLTDWASKYNVHEIEYDYKGSFEKRKNKGITREVLITNYE